MVPVQEKKQDGFPQTWDLFAGTEGGALGEAGSTAALRSSQRSAGGHRCWHLQGDYHPRQTHTETLTPPESRCSLGGWVVARTRASLKQVRGGRDGSAMALSNLLQLLSEALEPGMRVGPSGRTACWLPPQTGGASWSCSACAHPVLPLPPIHPGGLGLPGS